MTLKDIFKHIKKSKRYNLRCPACKSKRIIRLHTMEWLLPATYFCEDCGYTGNFLVEFEEKTK